MSLNNLLDDRTSLPAEDWVNLKVNSIRTANLVTGPIDIESLSIKDENNVKQFTIAYDQPSTSVIGYLINKFSSGMNKIFGFVPYILGSNIHENGRIDIATSSVSPTCAIYFEGGLNIGPYNSATYNNTLLSVYYHNNDTANGFFGISSLTSEIYYSIIDGSLICTFSVISPTVVTNVPNSRCYIEYKSPILYQYLDGFQVSTYFNDLDNGKFLVSLKRSENADDVLIEFTTPDLNSLNTLHRLFPISTTGFTRYRL